ncbi:MAG: M20/M25/M40 family metallo-hydrolase [Parcubacteria group bacterium]|jgi:acetylornithine deacetylase
MKAEKILAELVKINTVRDKENGKIMKFIAEYLVKRGFVVKFVTDEKTKKANLIAQLDPKKCNGLFFVGHTDTVPESQVWTKNPFVVTKESGKIYGLGTSDMKGGIAAFLAAIDTFDKEKIKTNLGMVLTYDEEISFSGIKAFLKKNIFKESLIIIGEPTDNIPIIATKGALAVRVEFFGKSAHGSVPAMGVNAILMAQQFIEKLLVLEKKLAKEKNALFNPSNATLNIAKINGGDAINKVPSNCVLDFEFRVIDTKQSKNILAYLENIVKHESMQASIEVLMNLSPMLNKGGDFIEIVEAITNNKAVAENYATEGSFLGGAGNQIVILGPGPMMAHMADEYITEKSFKKTINLYKQIIQESCF